MKSTLFVDINDLYYGCVKKFGPEKRLDYSKLFDHFEPVCAIAYGTSIGDEADGFIACLKQFGFLTKFKQPRIIQLEAKTIKKPEWEIGITVDVMKMADKLETVILATNKAHYVPLVEALREQGVYVIVCGFGVSRDLRLAANKTVELDEAYLETPVAAE